MKKTETKAETTVKETAAVSAEEKKAPKAAAKKTTEKDTAKKAPAKKTAEKETAKETVKKAPAKKTAVKETVYLQYLGKEIDKDDLMKRVKEVWTKQMKKKVGELKSVTLYLKPEENMVYYVINGDVTGSMDI